MEINYLFIWYKIKSLNELTEGKRMLAYLGIWLMLTGIYRLLPDSWWAVHN